MVRFVHPQTSFTLVEGEIPQGSPLRGFLAGLDRKAFDAIDASKCVVHVEERRAPFASGAQHCREDLGVSEVLVVVNTSDLGLGDAVITASSFDVALLRPFATPAFERVKEFVATLPPGAKWRVEPCIGYQGAYDVDYRGEGEPSPFPAGASRVVNNTTGYIGYSGSAQISAAGRIGGSC